MNVVINADFEDFTLEEKKGIPKRKTKSPNSRMWHG